MKTKRMVLVQIYLPEELHLKLKLLAKREHKSMAQLIRELIAVALTLDHGKTADA